jgi:hypothetical protein
MAEEFYVKAIWDPEAGVWCSESNIVGLVLETATLGEFENLARHFAPELLAKIWAFTARFQCVSKRLVDLT